MGLLGDIFSAGNTAKRRLRGLLDDPIGSMQQAVDNAFPTRYEAQNAISQLRGQQYNPDALQAYNTKLDSAAMNFAPMGLTVWHGSPHKFNKFDMSKIGTGEGAQAYGHGLYMAETPAVATEYRKKLSTGYTGGDGSLTHYGDAYQTAYDAAQSAGAVKPDHARAIASQVQEWVDSGKKASTFMRYNSVPKELEPAYKAAADAWKGFKPNDGAMYKVDIPDEAVARMLDWDKKLSEQIPEVQAVAKQWNNGTLPTGISTGDELLRYIQQQLGFIGSPKKAEQVLKEAGVPGIRYLDGGSRNVTQRYIAKHPMGGENVFNSQAELDAFVKRNPDFKAIYPDQTSNFVLFDDQMPRILEINGQATGQVPWKPNEWRGLLGGQ